jgi:2-C-methyl-D-erythritol 4-phosphate cytidylyltransferase / 2-C-methyl-D-erythritol 2,4-cyclodiphosphate synthase
MTDTAALIVAAGSGTRAPGDVPKQYRTLMGKPVLRWVLETYCGHPAIGRVITVISVKDRPNYENVASGLSFEGPVIGGPTRQESVRAGLEALADQPPARVLIHDGARPLISAALISRVAQALNGAEAAAPMLAVADTLRRKTRKGYELVPRDDLFRAQTPQGFHFGKILSAHRQFASVSVTDDWELAQMAGLRLAAVPGEETNMKLTAKEDFDFAGKLAAASLSDIRTGSGVDAHGFTEGDHVWMCGIKLPHDRALEGHSDADCGLHALTDAILAAICREDIGAHFSPSDPRWRGASSHLFLEHAAGLVREQGGVIAHVDVTIICERPKVAPHRDAMRARIAEILRMDIARVSVKATTTDGLGFTGRREGIAAHAVATVRLPG